MLLLEIQLVLLSTCCSSKFTEWILVEFDFGGLHHLLVVYIDQMYKLHMKLKSNFIVFLNSKEISPSKYWHHNLKYIMLIMLLSSAIVTWNIFYVENI
jgi:uncharacterized membrane protein SpoIIM required for sporulation